MKLFQRTDLVHISTIFIGMDGQFLQVIKLLVCIYVCVCVLSPFCNQTEHVFSVPSIIFRLNIMTFSVLLSFLGKCELTLFSVIPLYFIEQSELSFLFCSNQL